ncbi:MAG: phospholipid-binding protein MlaC [Sandaracinaceae bacterium]
MRFRHLLAFVVVAFVSVLGSRSHAQATARRYLEQKNEQVNSILRESPRTDAARERRQEELTRLLSGLLDFEALSRAALSEHWEARSPAERERFVTLLRQLVERNYQSNLERILDYEITYDGETVRGESTVVTTTARSRTERRQPPIEIEYTLRREGNDYRVVDVRTDGVSMVQNYRTQFGRIIDREGWGELISRMEHRLADED